eukprot:Nitzschia sp. Nitz4//scaffold4_size323378//94869//95798//NITZ4_000642-RA/size323378-processed-gene-0.85-mRNA-1//1//CDS//3329553345//6730//frame0
MGDSERKRKVNFHGRVQFKTIRHVADFTEQEINEGWYRKKDFMRMSEEVSEIAQMIASGKESNNGEELSIRGLEHLVEEDVADYRAEKMIASIDAVLDEQDEQRDEEVNDPEIIAKLYAEIVTPLQREAYLVGLRDAKEATLAASQLSELPPPGEVPSSSPEQETETPVEPEEEAPAEKAPAKTATKKKLPPKKKFDKSKVHVPTIVAAPSEEGEEMLNEDKEEPEEKPKQPVSAAERKAAAEKRKNRVRSGVASEMSPLVRRRDGSFAFRNKELEHAKAELKRERRDAVKSSLFKLLDSADDDDFDLR